MNDPEAISAANTCIAASFLLIFKYSATDETAEFMIRQFVPLTYQESTAVLHHHFALSFDSIKDTGVVGNVYNRYAIATLLHVADTISAFIDERY